MAKNEGTLRCPLENGMITRIFGPQFFQCLNRLDYLLLEGVIPSLSPDSGHRVLCG